MEFAVLALLAAAVVVQVLLWRRQAPPADLGPALARLEALERGLERTERGLREEVARNREEQSRETRAGREEIGRVLDGLTAENARKLEQIRGIVEDKLQQKLDRGFESLAKAVGERLDSMQLQIAAHREEVTRENRAAREEMQAAFASLKTENENKLEQIRATVDEKLQETLERRLGESFRTVSERLEQVHKGLGEMQALAAGVGDLKRVLSNVKVRGTWGEVQLRMLLEQLLTPEQWAENVTTSGTAERVEFAIRLPGADRDAPVWLPVDAKFPQEDYLRLAEASERGDLEALESASRQLEQRVRQCARDIAAKYIAPPATTDFAILYLPTEGLYAEVLRRTGVAESIQRDCRVVIAGPTTFAALLNSLQMGFRTLAIQQRSSEVWELLGVVKTEFDRYADVLARVQKKLQEAHNTVETGLTRTRAIQRKLRDVQELPSADFEPEEIEA